MNLVPPPIKNGAVAIKQKFDDRDTIKKAIEDARRGVNHVEDVVIAKIGVKPTAEPLADTIEVQQKRTLKMKQREEIAEDIDNLNKKLTVHHRPAGIWLAFFVLLFFEFFGNYGYIGTQGLRNPNRLAMSLLLTVTVFAICYFVAETARKANEKRLREEQAVPNLNLPMQHQPRTEEQQ